MWSLALIFIVTWQIHDPIDCAVLNEEPSPEGTRELHQLSKRDTQAPNPTIKTYHPFEPKLDAKNLHQAMKGWGTTESTITNILTHRTYKQRDEIAKVFESMYGYNFRTWLMHEISGTFREIIWDLMYRPNSILAGDLYWAVKGAGTDDVTLINILVPLNNNDFLDVETLFKTKSGYSLRYYVRDDTSGLFRDLLTMLIDKRRSEDEKVDLEDAKTEAKGMYYALKEAPWIREETVFHFILSTRSWAQLKTAFNFYDEYHGKNAFYKDASRTSKNIEGYPDKSYARLLQAIYQYAIDPDMFFAEALHTDLEWISAASWGPAMGVARVFTWRSEIDLGNIAKAFNIKYQKSLVEYVQDHASGDAKATLLGILQ